eukprot:6763554-Karenia_brevis.AAC.1
MDSTGTGPGGGGGGVSSRFSTGKPAKHIPKANEAIRPLSPIIRTELHAALAWSTWHTTWPLWAVSLLIMGP